MLTDYPWFDSITSQLNQANLNARLPHALLLVAPEKSAKGEFASVLSKSILCSSSSELMSYCGKCKSCMLFDAETHPDFYSLDRLFDAKGKQKKSIGIDQVRSLINKLQDTPQLGGYRIAIVHSVSAMTTASFNALLKTLEEPGEKTLLFLLADNQGTIPATIRSRCQVLKPKLEEELLSKWLVEFAQVSDEDAKEALRESYWAPLAALSFIKNEGKKALADFDNALNSVFTNQLTPGQFLDLVAQEEGNLIHKVADYFYRAQRQKSVQDKDSIFSKIPEKLIFQVYSKLLDLQRGQLAGSNLQTRLQIEAILIQWFEIGKKIGHYSKS